MALKFIKSMFLLKWARLTGRATLASSKEQQVRLDECLKCPQFEDGNCRRCGCLVYAKIMLTTEQCPDKRWLRIWRKRATIS